MGDFFYNYTFYRVNANSINFLFLIKQLLLFVFIQKVILYSNICLL